MQHYRIVLRIESPREQKHRVIAESLAAEVRAPSIEAALELRSEILEALRLALSDPATRRRLTSHGIDLRRIISGE